MRATMRIRWRNAFRQDASAPTRTWPARQSILRLAPATMWSVRRSQWTAVSPMRGPVSKAAGGRLKTSDPGDPRRDSMVQLDYVTIEKRRGIAVVRFDRKANLN